MGPSATCTLSGRTAASSEPHESNRYDRTFLGEFCICDRGKTYDPETEQDEMYQCLVCEDWRHAGCLGPHPHPDDFEALICARCVLGNADVNKLLQRWVGAENSGVMICLGEGEAQLKGRLESAAPPKSEPGTALPTVREEDETDEAPVVQPSSSSPYSGPVTLKRRASPSLDSPSKRARASPPPTDCLAPNPPPAALDHLAAAAPYENVYLADGWRDRWCRCKGPGGCIAFFDRLPYFLEEEDEVEVEEDEDSSASPGRLAVVGCADPERQSNRSTTSG